MSELGDEDLATVRTHLLSIRDFDQKVETAINEAVQLVIDGRHTGRYSIAELDKTEKTYIGTKVEHMLLFHLGLPKHHQIDTRIEGIRVDIKCTTGKNWTIPREALGVICIVVQINEPERWFRLGLIRITEVLLSSGKNRDGKRTLNPLGRSQIDWIVPDAPLARSVLAELDPELREDILRERSGNARFCKLFKLAQGRVVEATDIEAVGQQRDSSKRVRDARRIMADQGIVIYSHYDNPKLVELGYAPLKLGQFMALLVDDVQRT